VRPSRATSGMGQVWKLSSTFRAISRPFAGAAWVAGVEAAADLGPLALGEVFHAVAEQPADLVERVVLVAAAAQGVLLDAAPDLVDDLGAKPHDMEGVQDGDGVG
jgi:hypothetical protein